MATTYVQEAGAVPGARTSFGLGEPDHAARSAVSWPAILAGATAAAALSLIMLLLGTGMGLGMSSPWEGEGAEAKTVGIAAIFWITFTQVAASGLGGYLAGRLRSKWAGVHTDEARFRDTSHGFLAWGVATLVTFVLLASVVGSTLSAGARAGMTVAGGVASGAAVGAAGLAGSADANRSGGQEGGGVMSYWTDSLFRKDPAVAATPAPADAGTAQAAGAPMSRTATTAEAGRILANGLRTGTLPTEDARYVAQLVAQQTGLSQADAEKRVNDTFTRSKATIDEGKAKAKAAADAARKATAYGSLWIFLSLVIGALVAAYCASLGGRSRDL
ncbi:hypothetical protein [Variovorax saccharolyticus]|uniref:hypothetical protein n=1 Tax=Variovorax saccharolyticus TaxID=3053516 RepID=UPI00257641E1|nr:hypothetical protein [Variovorax sp. J31P216]MDM0029069.1 hypothetical protein [Variovorax sp. J31P216]